jgi:HK97 gp10 family phage protein
MADVLLHLEVAVLAMKGPAATATERAVGSRAADSMRSSVPVLSGELLGSIHDGPSEEGHEITVESDHAVFVEFGTVDMAAQPFLRPAMHVAENELPSVARSTYRRLVPYLH